MNRPRNATRVLPLLLSLLPLPLIAASPLLAVEPGKATGTVSIAGRATSLGFASLTTMENLFDSSKQDTVIVLSDRPLGDTEAGDDVGLSMKAREGELVVLSLRLDGSKLINAKLCYQGLDGYVQLPGTWFDYLPRGKNAGSLKLASREWEGTTYACAVEFAAAAAAPVKKPAAEAAVEPIAPAQPQPAAEAPPPPATTSDIEPGAATALLVQAMMSKDEHRALELIKLGAEPNGRDQYGVPVLSWAVMMCQPKVVKALVEAKADLAYERAPGLTILQEAGACPEAARILKAAGAR